MDKFVSVMEIRLAEEDLGFKVDAYLRSKGWRNTSKTPGCYWMWLREIDGVTYMVERDHAVRIQAHLENAEPAPEAAHVEA
jgi:hypothetical protein